jgi:hypothetical protein
MYNEAEIRAEAVKEHGGKGTSHFSGTIIVAPRLCFLFVIGRRRIQIARFDRQIRGDTAS